ncbi:MAG: helix-turn-helix domain-containing protein [Ruminococcus sp.]|jgi:predicted transcriptional regulator|nr:helix-turn-helix domain-containing protein [Ruminococcus sp.]
MKTAEMMRRIQNAKTLTRILRDIPDFPEFGEYFKALLNEQDIKKDVFFKRAGISTVYGHEILRGKKKPSRDTIIQLALTLGLDIEKTQEILKIGGAAELYPKIKRDTIFIFGITNKQKIEDVNIKLLENDLPILGKY